MAAAPPVCRHHWLIETPAGPWTLRWRYEPGPWRLGLLIACLSWIMLARSWYHRAVATGETG